MPFVDRRTNNVVLRIVYDGLPDAGKTTNLKHLCERLSLSRRGVLESRSGHEPGRYFDWLDVNRGWVGGQRVQCQLIAAPGQIQLARRRRDILDSADAVVFVADSRATAASETSAALRSLVRGLGNRPDVPLVLQANKQDLPDAQLPSDLHHALGLAARVPVIGTRAVGGTGVLETFMVAVGFAVDHVRALLVGGELGEDSATMATDLLRALEAMPEVLDELDAIASAADAAVALRPRVDASAAVDAVPPPGPEPEPAAGAPDLIATAPIAWELEMAAWDLAPTETELTPLPAAGLAPGAAAVEPPAHASSAAPEAIVEVAELSDLGEVVELREVADVGRLGEVAAPGEAIELGEVIELRKVVEPGEVGDIIELRDVIERRHKASAPGPLPRTLRGAPLPLDALALRLPPADLPAGLVWPSISGRAALAALTLPVRITTVATSWAPAAAIELACGSGWLAHTSHELVFAELDRGRRALFDAVRWQARMAHLMPAGRTYALSTETQGARLWVVTPVYRTAWVAIEDAFTRGDRDAVGRLARLALQVVDEARLRGAPVGDLDHIAIGDTWRLLTTPWTPASERLTTQLERLFAATVL